MNIAISWDVFWAVIAAILSLATAIVLLAGFLAGLAYAVDKSQKYDAIRRNFPLFGWGRQIGIWTGDKVRQYWINRNDEGRPFSRDERNEINGFARAKPLVKGFGSDNNLEQARDVPLLLHGEPSHRRVEDPLFSIPVLKKLGGSHNRRHAFYMPNIQSISAMSFGSLGRNFVIALNRGGKIADVLHNTGEGGISPYHLEPDGADLIYQIGTGYFGCRNSDGTFSMEKLLETLAKASGRVKAIEIKLSQGAKPGKGGILLAAKVTPEIAEIRGIPVGKDCYSPAYHTAFSTANELIDFIERIAQETGLPVGIKLCVGKMDFIIQLADEMAKDRSRGPDFIAVDGGEGGTGAAPNSFADGVGLPFRIGFPRVFAEFAKRGIDKDIVFIGSGKLGITKNAIFAFAMGCDAISIAREVMIAGGCIQAQQCHSGHCPWGGTTHDEKLQAGLVPAVAAKRIGNYLIHYRSEILQLTHAAGKDHPGLLTPEDFEILNGRFECKPTRAYLGYEEGWATPSEAEREQVVELTVDGRATH